jgi:uncharacterized protein (DUF433 family)
MRLQDEQVSRLRRFARTVGKTPGELSALWIEERLREAEFAFIEFRPSAVGRQAYLRGSRVTVWWVIHVAKAYQMSVEKTAAYFQRPDVWVKAAMNYYEAYPEEIDQAIEDHLSVDYESVKRMLPGVELLEVSIGDAA